MEIKDSPEGSALAVERRGKSGIAFSRDFVYFDKVLF